MKMDLPLNNLQKLMCQKTPNKQTRSWCITMLVEARGFNTTGVASNELCTTVRIFQSLITGQNSLKQCSHHWLEGILSSGLKCMSELMTTIFQNKIDWIQLIRNMTKKPCGYLITSTELLSFVVDCNFSQVCFTKHAIVKRSFPIAISHQFIKLIDRPWPFLSVDVATISQFFISGILIVAFFFL